MSDITPISGPAAPPLVSTSRQSNVSPAPATSRDQNDQAEFSEVARYLSKLSENPVRSELIDRVRSEIDADGYVTSDKIDALLDELLADLDV